VRDPEQIADCSPILGNQIEVAHLAEPVGPSSRSANQIPSGIARKRKGRCKCRSMSTMSRQVIYGSRIMCAKMRAEVEATSIPMVGYGGPAQPSPTIAQCLNGGYGWLEVERHPCKARASIPLAAIRCPRNTPIWKLEAALKCQSCRKGRYSPLFHMIKLTQESTFGCVRTRRGEPGCSPKEIFYSGFVRGMNA
jgi:hypothetical protein